MGETTRIEWTDRTWSPWEGCTKVSPACDHCYAERQNKWLHKGENWGPGAPRRVFGSAHWDKPRRWNAALAKAGRVESVFPSMCDPFDNEVAPIVRSAFWQLIADTPNLRWLLLTKRVGNVRGMVPPAWLESWPANVVPGATVVTQEEVDRDIPKLLALPAPAPFISVEPMLGPITLLSLPAASKVWPGRHHLGNNIECRRHMDALRGIIGWVGGVDPHEAPDETGLPHLAWVIAGGESGQRARPSHPDWFRSLRDQCVAAGVPFLFKQWGEWAMARPDHHPTAAAHWWKDNPGHVYSMVRLGKDAAGRLLDGRAWDEMPWGTMPAIGRA